VPQLAFLLADDALSEQLRSGDVVLFSRKCSAYQVVTRSCTDIFVIYHVLCFVIVSQPLGAAKCYFNRWQTRAEFDHAGIILLRRGVPFVLESTHSGTKVISAFIVCVDAGGDSLLVTAARI
jgi:hypothetical protein